MRSPEPASVPLATDAIATMLPPPRTIAALIPPMAFRTPLRVRRCSLNMAP